MIDNLKKVFSLSIHIEHTSPHPNPIHQSAQRAQPAHLAGCRSVFVPTHPAFRSSTQKCGIEYADRAPIPIPSTYDLAGFDLIITRPFSILDQFEPLCHIVSRLKFLLWGGREVELPTASQEDKVIVVVRVLNDWQV
jgi:hypothetical protein